eukprot:7272013-Ditylum_brightwellii.AAC.1
MSLLGELKNDICQTTGKYLIMFDNNAALCYDRIIPSISSILARKKGLYKNITFVHGKTLQEAQYQLKTVIGWPRCHELSQYLADINSTLADIYDNEAHGATFITSPDKQSNAKRTLLGLVDNVTNQANEFLNNEVTA